MQIDVELERRAAVHAALSDPVRLGIVDELTWSDRMPSELQATFDVSSNLLAHHLQVLEDAGLVSRSVSNGDRRRRYVHLHADLGALTPVTRFRAPGVAFVCTRNSARSQLAAALWATVSEIPAISGGTDPATSVHPGAVRAAARRGIDLGDARPAAIAPATVDSRLVVTVCDLAHEALDDLAKSTPLPVLHWSIADPAVAGTRAAFDTTADDLTRRITSLAAVTTAA